jgi:flagellar motility protein MotE (MotC chaperone)
MAGNNSDNTTYTVCYPENDTRAEWEDEADDYDRSLSGFIVSRVEAGRRKFGATVESDETRQKLRDLIDNLKAERDHLRKRITKLEDMLARSDSAEIERFIERNPGADFDAIVERLRETAPERANEHLTAMEGESIEDRGDGYYPKPDSENVQQQHQQQEVRP